MEHLNIAICEDDDKEYKKLITLLNSDDISCTCTHFSDGTELVKTYRKGKYDLLLIDIYMPGMNGIETISHIRQFDPDITAAFLTTSLDHALDGYRYHIDRYLVKPIVPADLKELLDKAIQAKAYAPSIDIPFNGKFIHVQLSHICYLEASGHSVLVHLSGDEVLKTSEKLSRLLDSLPQPPFFFCHKSYIVNLSYVAFLNKELNVFEMSEGGMVYIRRESVSKAEKAYHECMFALARERND